jgi:hypothetical protein
LENSDRPREAGERLPVGKIESVLPGSIASLRGCSFAARHCVAQLASERVERRVVRIPLRLDYDIYGGQGSQKLNPNDFAQSPLELIPFDGSMPKLRHDEPNPWMTQRGSERSDLQVFGPNTLPLLADPLNI